MAARSLDPNQFVEANRNLAPVSLNPKGHTLGIIGFGQIGRRTADEACSNELVTVLGQEPGWVSPDSQLRVTFPGVVQEQPYIASRVV